MKLELVYLALDKLTPYEGNARKHEIQDITAIKKSIERYGFDDPIGIWSDKNIIVEGHGRLMAAKELGLESVPCIRLDHLTDEERRAYALAHNKTAELSSWDFAALNRELLALNDDGMQDFGFAATQEELEAFFDASPKPELKKNPCKCPRCGAEVEE